MIKVYYKSLLGKAKLGYLLLAVLFLYFSASPALSQNAQIEASVTFVKALSLTAKEMGFGKIEIINGAAANIVSLSAADGSLSCSNNVDYGCPSTGVRGELDINGSAGMAVNISCETNGALSDGTDSIDLQNTEISISGSALTCNGINMTSATHTLGAPLGDKVYIGGELNITAAGIAVGDYNTSNSGGAPIAIKVLYQ